MPAADEVQLSLFDVTGRRLASRPVALDAGNHDLEWSVGRLQPGLYWIDMRLKGERKASVRLLSR